MELLYADDLVLMAESEELLMKKLRKWKKGMEAKGLRVNYGKTKAMQCRDSSFQSEDTAEKASMVSTRKELLATQSCVQVVSDGIIKDVVVFQKS